MTEQNFYRLMSSKTGFTQRNCRIACNAVLESIRDIVYNNDSVTFQNFGTFSGSYLPEHVKSFFGNNIIVPPRTKPSFKFSNTIKEFLRTGANLKMIQRGNTEECEEEIEDLECDEEEEMEDEK